jgi:hypothetical protein
MGTWGPGHLDSDGAHDHLGERSSALIAAVWDALRDPGSSEADEHLHDALFVDLEWLRILAAADRLALWTLPPAAEVESATEAWLARWDAYMDGLAGPAFKAERRAVIEPTFAELIALARTNDRARGRVTAG